MDASFLRKAFALIAKGIIEKEEFLHKNPRTYPYSRTLQHGINMFLAASYEVGCKSIWQYADEASFLAHYITKPIAEWFNDWDPAVLEKLRLQEEPFYVYEAFAYRRDENLYTPSADCYEFLDIQDSDILDGTDERMLYERMSVLDQENYCKIRRYLIENPIITLEDRRKMSLALADDQAAREAFQFAYEEITEDSYRCPTCGWTMTVGKYGYLCHSSHCTDITPELTKTLRLDISTGNLYRLKKGIMRYFAMPGKLELEIAAYCETKGLGWKLWPQMDRYDVEIQFADGEIWEIDAKSYRSPIALRSKIQSDHGFPEGDYARGYFVIPSEYVRNQRNYTAIINRVLADQENVKCVTFTSLQREIVKKEAECREKQTEN